MNLRIISFGIELLAATTIAFSSDIMVADTMMTEAIEVLSLLFREIVVHQLLSKAIPQAFQSGHRGYVTGYIVRLRLVSSKSHGYKDTYDNKR